LLGWAWPGETLWAQTPHTIAIDGTNDFAANEDVPGTSGSTWYFTWDANNFYFGITASDVAANDPNKWVLLYLDTDPRQNPLSGNGTSTGQQYSNQTPGLPFFADYHFRWKTNNSFMELQQWNGSSWVTGNNTGIAAFQSGTFVEFQIPRANPGSPAAVYTCGAMINEAAGGEFTFFMTPSSNVQGFDANFTHSINRTPSTVMSNHPLRSPTTARSTARSRLGRCRRSHCRA